jgi:uncharacterized GH25 family protein
MTLQNIRIWLCLIVLATETFPSVAHEFWVAPSTYTPDQGSMLAIGLKVGQMMKGADYPYLSDKFESFTITTREGTRNAEGVEGDIPAISYSADDPGLHVVAFHASPYPITFDTLTEFEDYLKYEGLGAIALAHSARGLPPIGITERYIRCAKALVQVGPISETDLDKPLGLPFELVAVANPYTAGLEALSVILSWKGEPVAGRQLAVFRDNGEVTRTLLTTDTSGRATIPLAGGGEFLLNAVNMEPVEGSDAMWESHWASLTFGLPIRK